MAVGCHRRAPITQIKPQLAPTAAARPASPPAQTKKAPQTKPATQATLRRERQAAVHGSPQAAYRLGEYYASRDRLRAYKWFLLAKARLVGTNPIYWMVSRKLNELRQHMTPEQVAQAIAAARKINPDAGPRLRKKPATR